MESRSCWSILQLDRTRKSNTFATKLHAFSSQLTLSLARNVIAVAKRWLTKKIGMPSNVQLPMQQKNNENSQQRETSYSMAKFQNRT